jgi:hypothetical protein
MNENTPFVPILTVMQEIGMVPFLWLADRPDQEGSVGACICDCVCREDSILSKELWRKLADWAIEGEPQHDDDDDWDWIAYNAHGLQLSRLLKKEVGDAYRVFYVKPCEDTNSNIDNAKEILADGSVVTLPESCDDKQRRFCWRIISGGQTGADRAALDFAITYYQYAGCYSHGGWVPQGREAEDGRIPMKYRVTELPEGDYRQCTRRNVEDSDGTLIVNLGELDGGTLATQTFAQQAGKPHLVVQLDDGVTAEIAANVHAWLRAHAIKTLNVAGPCESKRPGIYRLTGELLYVIDVMLYQS